MSWIDVVRSTADSLFRRVRAEREMEEEMRFHIEMEARALEERGLPPAEARRRAARDFGGVEYHKENVRDARGTRWADDLVQDLRYGTRAMRRRPVFALVATLTLALGVGATTALFGVVRSVLLTPLPYGDPASIAMLWSSWRGFDQTWLSFDEYEAYETEIPAIANAAIWRDGAATLTVGDQSERLRASFVQHDVFSILDVSPRIGRDFTTEEDRPAGPPVVILGNATWQRHFGGDASIVGRSVMVNGASRVVVGVLPPDFRLPTEFDGGGASELWMPLGVDAASEGVPPGPTFQHGGGSHGFYGIARLRVGATTEQATRQMADMYARLVQQGIISAEKQFRALAVPVTEQVTGRVRPVLLVTFAAVGLVLMIACANVAGLLLVRSESRRRELAVRVALGAGSGRIGRQLFTEALLISVVGGVAGVALAWSGLWLVRRAAPATLPRVAEASIDPWVVAFALGAAGFAALLSGTLPALHGRRIPPGMVLKEGGRSATVGGGRLRWRQALVSVEVALAVVLVAGAGLMIRSVANLFAIDTGFDPRGVLTMRISTPSAWYGDSLRVNAFHDELRQRLTALPGVEAAGLVRILPLATEMGDWGLAVEGYQPPPNTGTPSDWQVASPGYFEAMRLRLVKGRMLEGRDRMEAPLTMVVNRRFTELYTEGREPLGVRVRIGGSDSGLVYTIVGVVENVRHNGLTRDVKAQFYVTPAQFARAPGNTSRSMTLVVRTDGRDPLTLATDVRRTIREIDPRLPISEVRRMTDVVAGAVAAPRFAMQLLTLFGVLALVLSAIGIFGIVSQVVTARAQEFGIRAALGASPRDLVMLGLGAGVRQALVGLAVGLAASLAVTRVLTSMLHGVTPTDIATFAGVVIVTGVVAIGSSLGPAWRAGRSDPAVVLHDG